MFRIETDRFMWGADDEYTTLADARRAVRQFLEECRTDGQRGWRRTDVGDDDVVAEWEHVSWDPSKPERVRIVIA